MAVVKSSVFYVAAEIFKKCLGFAILPILTRLLTPLEYGVIGTLMACRGLLSQAMPLGMTVALHRLYFSYESASSELKHFLTSNLLFTILTGATICLVIDRLALTGTANLLFADPAYEPHVRITVWTVYLGLPFAILLPLLASEQRSIAVSVLDTSRFIVENGCIILFIGAFSWGIMGYLTGQLLVAGVFMAISAVVFIRDFGTLGYQTHHVKTALRFGLPLLPAMILGWVLSLSDRVIMAQYCSLNAIGLYSLAASLGTMVMLVLAAFERAWTPWFYHSMRSNSREFRQLFSDLALAWLAIVGFGCVGGCLFSRELLSLVVDDSFIEAFRFIPPLMIGAFLVSIYGFATVFLYHEQRTKVFTWVLTVAAVVNVGLNLLLVPVFGPMAAAYTTMVAYIVTTILYFYVSRIHKRLVVHQVRTMVLLSATVLLSLSPAIVESAIVRVQLLLAFTGGAYFCLGKATIIRWPELWKQIRTA